MQDKTYNGWTNYATWRVNLEMFDGLNPHEMGWRGSAWDIEDTIHEWAAEFIYETTSEGVARDYALAFLSEVNWLEIAQHMVADYCEEGAA